MLSDFARRLRRVQSSFAAIQNKQFPKTLNCTIAKAIQAKLAREAFGSARPAREPMARIAAIASHDRPRISIGAIQAASGPSHEIFGCRCVRSTRAWTATNTNSPVAVQAKRKDAIPARYAGERDFVLSRLGET